MGSSIQNETYKIHMLRDMPPLGRMQKPVTCFCTNFGLGVLLDQIRVWAGTSTNAKSDGDIYSPFSMLIRVGLGQNGQILFISVEQLSFNVAGDSAKTLSVLGNIFFFRWLSPQICADLAAPPFKYPRFLGSNGFFKILPKKDPYRNHTKSMN